MTYPNPLKVTLALLASASLQQPAQAARLAYEGFDYTQANGTSVAGLNGGTGWLEAFPTPDGPHVLADGLTFTGLTTVGKSMNRSNGTLTGDGRNWASSFTSSTYWYSLLVRSTIGTDGNGPEGTFNLFQQTSAEPGAFTPQNGTGLEFRKGTSGALQIKAIGNGGATDVRLVPGAQTHWVLGKVTNSSHQVWVYAQSEALPTVEPTSGGTTIGGTPLTFRQAAMSGRRFGSSGANSSITFDEICVGTTFADAFPPPIVLLPTFVLSPTTGAEGRALTFTWENIPAGVTAMELDPGNIPLTPSTSGTHGPILAPSTNETYTLTYTVDGIDSTLTQNFTVIPPNFTLSPLTGYAGDTLTLNWQVPVGSTDVTLTPDVGTPVVLTTDPTTGAGTTTLPAPSVITVYRLSYTYNSTTVTLSTTPTFTPNASVLSVTPEVAVATRPLTISWRILPEWDNNTVPEDNVVLLQSSPSGDFVNDLLDNVVVTTNTNGTTGAGTYNTAPNVLNATLGLTQYRLVYKIGGVETVVADTITQVQPLILTNITASGLIDAVNKYPVVNTALMNEGVPAYNDRDHVWKAIPSFLQGAQFVKLAQNDKLSAAFQVSFTAAETGTFFLLLDNRVGDAAGGTNPAAGTDSPPLLPNTAGTMAWVMNSGFVDSGVDIGLDEGANATIDQSYSVYFRQVNQGETFTFYEQNDTSTGDANLRNMYGIAAVTPQVVPIAFVVTVPVITNGASTTLQWTVPPGSTVTINQGVGVMTDQTDPATGVGSTFVNPTATTAYTLTYDPPGAATPAVNIGPVSVTVNNFAVTPDTITEGQNATLTWQVPVGATAVTINNGVGDVTLDTDANGAGSKDIKPTVSGSYTLSYLAAGATTPTNVATLYVTVVPLATPFQIWIGGDFGGNAVPLEQQGPNDDPDQDGIDNLVEYAMLGGDPTRSNVTPAVINGTLVTFNKNLTAAGISYALEKSGDLVNWVPATATTDDANLITYTLAPPSPASEFIRLKVAQN
jgi:hypothetical protein